MSSGLLSLSNHVNHNYLETTPLLQLHVRLAINLEMMQFSIKHCRERVVFQLLKLDRRVKEWGMLNVFSTEKKAMGDSEICAIAKIEHLNMW